jgi:hypothetical protein
MVFMREQCEWNTGSVHRWGGGFRQPYRYEHGLNYRIDGVFDKVMRACTVLHTSMDVDRTLVL